MHSLWLDCTNLYPLGQRLYGDYFFTNHYREEGFSSTIIIPIMYALSPLEVENLSGKLGSSYVIDG